MSDSIPLRGWYGGWPCALRKNRPTAGSENPLGVPGALLTGGLLEETLEGDSSAEGCRRRAPRPALPRAGRRAYRRLGRGNAIRPSPLPPRREPTAPAECVLARSARPLEKRLDVGARLGRGKDGHN